MQPDLTETFGTYLSWKYSDDTWIISFMGGSQFMYLLEGERSALLIDTGWGAGNLRAHVEGLTDRPVLVANTHGHLDHAGGNGEWESVWMLPGAQDDLYTCRRSPFDLSKLPHPDYERRLAADGDTIDLGGREIALLDISAHSNGSLAFLDRKNGFLFVGDEVESKQVLLYETEAIPGVRFRLEERLAAHHRNMLRLKGLAGEWHTLFPAHNGAPIAPAYLDDHIALTQHIWAGDAAIEDKLCHKYAEAGDPEGRLCRVRWGRASFFVVKEDLLDLWGKGPR